jgi:dihydropteroate synthase
MFNFQVARMQEMVRQGADIIDIGGQSTRPNVSDGYDS